MKYHLWDISSMYNSTSATKQMGITRTLFAIATLVLVAAFPAKSFADPTNAIYLTMDGSASISTADFALQRDGYVSALNNVITPSLYGHVAIGVSVFGATVVEIIPMQIINDAGDLAALTGIVAALDPTQGPPDTGRAGIDQGMTHTGQAILDAEAAIQTTFPLAPNKVIDVSTDGDVNGGPDADTAATDALTNNAITTNCLGVGDFADCSFVTGFTSLISSFADFEQALTDKLQAELVKAVNIDIKPGSDPNCFNINGNGVVPVAILGNEDFDVTQIDPTTLLFGGLEVRVRGNKGPLCSFEYSNVDAYLDLVCHFEDDADSWVPGDDEATLTGSLSDGQLFEGSDSICIVP
jgi:hypothetical protein